MASSMGEGLSLTAVARAWTGKQWLQFDGDENKRLFPYIEWLPSRSATPRETHRVFWHCRWRKDDNFWKENQPGTLWNCKCDWEQTDEDPTSDNPTSRIVKPGLDKNPATSGQIFTDTAPYIRKARSNGQKVVEDFFRPIAEHNKEYLSYRKNPDYRDVDFNWNNGGLKATHKNHKTHPNDNQYFFPEKLTGDQLEKKFMDNAYNLGHSVIFKAESAKVVDLDMFLDGKLMELVSVTENSNNFRNQLNRKNRQLKDYNTLHGEDNNSVCMYFHDPSYYSYEKVKTGLEELGKYTNIQIKTVYILKNDGTDIMELEF